MNKITKRIILTATALLAVIMPAALVVTPAFAQISGVSGDANIQESLCKGGNLDVTDGNCKTNPVEAQETVNDIIGTVINIFSIVVGVTAVIMIIVGGFQYITSGGDSGKVTTAKNTILFAIVGLVIVALAQVIVNFVLSKATDI
ncbi:MAG TPA: pilin [Candidatus Saccharibacteria bacterium]|nr:pilin [Candidatus Saccharibacteria bacterium]